MESLKLPQAVHDYILGLIAHSKDAGQRLWAHAQCTRYPRQESFPWSWVLFRIQDNKIDLIWEWNKSKDEAYIYNVGTKERIDTFKCNGNDPTCSSRGERLFQFQYPGDFWQWQSLICHVAGWKIYINYVFLTRV